MNTGYTEASTGVEIFNEFKQACPNSNEDYIPTIENLQRWMWHISQYKKRIERNRPKFVNHSMGFDWAEGRKVFYFEDFSKGTQKKYLKLAQIYYPRQVYATGSRVNGTFINNGNKDIRYLRRLSGKADKINSDYDFVVTVFPGETIDDMRAMCPAWADVLPFGVPENEKIEVPMWDFSKLPDAKHAEMIALYNEKQYGKIMAMHNQYQLSPHHYCCDSRPIIRWVRWAIDNGHLSAK